MRAAHASDAQYRGQGRAPRGSIINRAALEGGALEVKAKNKNDFVTQVDKAAEQAIINVIRAAYPDHSILAEESGDTPGARAEYLWVIDPLDGTTNYIHGFPQYCVSIGLEHRGVLTQGVVYDPGKNELFTASRGRGAFLDDRRMRVSKCTQLKDALVGTGFPFKEHSRLDLYMRQLQTLMTSSARVRRAGRGADLATSPRGAWMRSGRWAVALGHGGGRALTRRRAGWSATCREGPASWTRARLPPGTPKVLAQLLEALNNLGPEWEPPVYADPRCPRTWPSTI